MSTSPIEVTGNNAVVNDGTEIDRISGYAWTGVTTVYQQHTEALQNARETQQAAYDLAQGSNGTARDSAALANIELDVAARANHQAGVHTMPAAPAAGA